MSDVERTALGDTLAGQNQYKVFAAVLQNFDTAVEATATAYNSAGSAAKENERSIDSLEGHTNNLKAAFEDLSNNVIPNELIKSLLDLATGFLNAANSGIGQFLIRFTLISTTVLGASTMFTQLAVKVLPMLKAAFVSAAGGAITLNAALGWISIALGVLAAVIPAIIDAWKDSHKSAKELSDELTSLNEQLSTNKDRIEEINNLSWSEHTAAINREYYALLAENEELERNIKLKQTEIKEKAETGEVQTGIGYQVSAYDIGQLKSNVPEDLLTRANQGLITQEQYDKAIDDFNEWIKKLEGVVFDSYEDMYDAINSYDFSFVGYDPDLIERWRNQLLKTSSSVNQYVNGVSNAIPELEKYNNLLDQQGVLTAAQNEDYIELMDSAGDYYIGLRQLYDANQPIGEDNEKFIKQYEQLAKKYNDAKAAVDNFGVSIGTINKFSPQLYTYMSQNGFTVKAFADYCKDAKVDVVNLAEALIGSANAWKSFADAAAAGYGFIMTAVEFQRNKSYRQKYGSYQDYLAAMQAQYSPTNADTQIAFLEKLKNLGSTTTGGTGDDDKKGKTLTQAEKNLQEFRSQLAYLDHELAMNNISTEQYYSRLQQLMDAYLQDAENVETLWKYQEKIYKHSQEELQNYYQEQLDQQNALIHKINERFDAEIAGLEKSNDELEKQIEYEQLLEDMASAKAKKSLVFKNGAFQYVEDVDAISSAQNALRKYYREQEVEQRKQNIEAARQRALQEPQQLVTRLEEIIKNIKGYATGTTYSAGGLSLVGEHGAELAVLSKGTGVIPADVTKNLWAWGQTTPSALMSTVAGVNGQNGGIYFSGVTMSFPSVRNGNDAQSFMQSVVNLAYQRAYSRK